MFLDRQNTVSQAQAITATAVSTDTIDLSQARDIGVGEELKFSITIDQVFNNLTSLTPQVVISAAANLSSPTVLAALDPIPLAQLVAGRKPIELSILRTTLLAQPIGQRYLGLNYVVAGTAPTTGQVTAGIVVGSFQDVGKNYPGGYTVL